MIRITTTRRLQELRADVERAQARTRLVQEQSDHAFAGHVQSAFDLTGRAERAERETANVRHDALLLQLTLEDTATELADARAELAAHDERIAVLVKELDAARAAGGSPMVHILFRRTVIHSVHTTNEAAEEEAARHGAPRDGWRPEPRAPQSGSADVEWRIVHQYVAPDGGDPQ